MSNTDMQKCYFLFLWIFLFHIQTQAQVNADFSASETQGCGSLQVNFEDLSTSSGGTIVSWVWDLGGVASSNQSPGRIFGTPGSYTICLTVTDNQGNSDTECKDQFIQVFQLPEPGITVDQSAGCSPLIVTFTDASTSQNGTITDWIWGVGGTAGVVNQTGTSDIFSSTYNLTDSYAVNLTVIDDNGCQATLTEADFITVFPDPVVSFEANQVFSCTTPFLVDFANLNIEPGTNYTWNFGNGETFQGANPPSVSYDQVGSYTVEVVAEIASSGCRDTLRIEDYIQVGNDINIEIGLTEACPGEPISFVLNAVETDSVQWGFGNGDQSSALNPTYSFDDPGCYFVTLIHYFDGCETIISAPDCINIFPAPVSNGSVDASLACELPHEVDFTSFALGGDIFTWDFGDGNTSNQPNPTYTYTNYGTYVVRLLVGNNSGCEDERIIDTIQVQPLIPQLDMPLPGGCIPYTVNLTENTQTLGSITSWEWIIDTTGSDLSTPYLTFTDPNPSFELVDTGTYDIILMVTNDLGCTARDTFPAQISGGDLIEVNFEADPRVVCVETGVAFTDLSSEFADQWFWDFGDGGTAVDANPDHEYSDTGFFTVTLLAFYNGCESDTTLVDYIYVQPPVAFFELERDCSAPFNVQVADRSIGADSIFYYLDVAGDLSQNTTDSDPLVNYPDTGRYSIMQIVGNFDTGCVDTHRIDLYITQPIADFSLDPLEGCVPLEVQLTNNSAFAANSIWSAPGGTLSNPNGVNPTITYTETGTFSNIQLVITDPNNCRDTATYTGDILVNGVEVDFTALPTGGCRPLEVGFNAITSSTFGDIVSYEWDFGGVGTSNEPSPQFTFTEEGLYDVQLTVTDSWGCVATLTQNEFIEVTQPAPLFTTVDTISCTNGIVQFESLSVGNDLNHLWDFGDGTTSIEENPTHTYTQEGIYDVCLTLSNSFGCDSTLCKDAYIIVADPIAAFEADQTFANCPPMIVNFSNLSQNASVFSWDFGNNAGISDQETPSNAYTQPGAFDVTLIAGTTDQCQDTLTIPEYISLEGPVGAFEFTFDDLCAPSPVTFTARALESYTLIWDFGNGDLDTTLNVAQDSLQYIYSQEGSFVPKLVLIDSENCQVTLESPDTIQLGLLALDFVATDTLFCDRIAPVTFFNLTNSTDPITNILWTFEEGDPDSTNVLEPQVTYMGAGMYDVALRVETEFCIDSLFRSDFIKIGPNPVAAFTPNQEEACLPSTISFTDASSVQGGQVTGWNWDFGNLNTSTIQNPSQLYSQVDTFTVTLIASSDMGCVDTTSSEIIIRPLPEVEVSGDTTICTGSGVGITASFIPDTLTGNFLWVGPELSCTNCPDPIASPQQDSEYFVIGFNEFGCRDSAMLTVFVRPDVAPAITISADTSVCANGVVQLNVSGGVDVFSYQWDTTRLGLSCYENCFNPVAMPDSSQYYVVEVTNGLCTAVDSVFVEVIDDFFEFTGEDRTICRGDSVRLVAGQVQDPIWVISDGLDCANCVAPVASPDTTINYIVQALSSGGCPIADTIQVRVLGSEDIEAGPDSTICRGNEVLVNGIGTGVG